MGVIRELKDEKLGKVMIESYASANSVVDELESREVTDHRFHKDPYEENGSGFTGVKDRAEAMKLLREGYQPSVDLFKQAVRIKAKGRADDKRYKFHDDVIGFVPIVPSAIMGLPKSMRNGSMTQIKLKVLDIYYDMTASCGTDFKDIIAAGNKMVSAVIALEKQGYRFNLYSIQSYSENKDVDILCVKVKGANQLLDLKRMSFCMSHSGFFRGVGFDWYSKCPKAKYRSGYGRALGYSHQMPEIDAAFKRMFGKGSVYFSCKEVIEEDPEHIRKVLTGGYGNGEK